MSRKIGPVALLALCLSVLAIALPAQEEDREKANADRERAQIEKEIADLEAQRAKLDARIEELSRKIGRTERRRIVVPRVERFEGKELTPEERKKIKEDVGRALKEAHEAMEKTLKDWPDLIPDIDRIVEKSLLLVTPDGKIQRFERMSPEEREKLKKNMQRMREDLRAQLEDIQRNMPKMRVFRLDKKDAAAKDADPSLRREIDKLRRELESLREEIRRDRRERERRGTSTDTSPTTLDPL